MKCLAIGLLLITSVSAAKSGPVHHRLKVPGKLQSHVYPQLHSSLDSAFGEVSQTASVPAPPDSSGLVVRHAREAKQFAVRVFGPRPPSSSAPAYEAAFGFNFVHANAGPSGCGCFHMYGENAQFAVVPRGGLAAVADFGRSTANNISGQGHNITLTTYLAGVRYPFKPYKRMASYAEILIGLGHSDTNFAIDSSATNFAYAFGGGVTYPLGHGFDVKLLELDFLGTLIPNGINDRQNQLRLTSGVVYHFKRTAETPPALVPAPKGPPVP